MGAAVNHLEVMLAVGSLLSVIGIIALTVSWVLARFIRIHGITCSVTAFTD